MQENNHPNEPLDLPAETAETKPRPRPKPRPASSKKPTAKKRPQPQPEDDLPEWLGKLVDWIADTPKRLKALPKRLNTLPKRFAKLWGSLFYRVYFIAVAVALVAIFIGLHWLTGVVADYEIAEPSHAADDVVRLFEEGDYDQIYDIDTSAQDISDGDRTFYVDSLKNLSAGKQVGWSFVSEADGQRKYAVTLDGGRFADFTLVPSGETTSHGNTLWKLGTITTNVVTEKKLQEDDPTLAAYHVQAPADCAVAVDGRALTEADIIRRDISVLPDKFELPKGVTAPTLVEYGFNSENEKPDIKVTDSSGAEMSVNEASEGIWVCNPREDAEMKAKCEDAVGKLAQRIAKFTSQDLSQGAILDSTVPGSPAETQLKRFSNRWAPTHKSVRFENMEVSQFYVLSNDCFTCHVSFDFIIVSVRDNDYPYHTEYTFCVSKYHGNGKLYNLTFN